MRSDKYLYGGKKMPIRKTQQGYWWGSKGPFPTRQKAEEVAAAAYSHGYKKPEKNPQQKK